MLLIKKLPHAALSKFILVSSLYTLGAQAAPARWDHETAAAKLWSNQTSLAVGLSGALMKTLPNDYQEFCPELKGSNVKEKKAFYTYLISAMAQLESGFNTALSYRESFRNDSGQLVVSRGLLQLSRQSANYYDCGFSNEASLHSAIQNLKCGVKILNHWVGRDHSIAGAGGGSHGAARYWAVLRGSKGSQIKGWTRSFCRENL